MCTTTRACTNLQIYMCILSTFTILQHKICKLDKYTYLPNYVPVSTTVQHPLLYNHCKVANSTRYVCTSVRKSP